MTSDPAAIPPATRNEPPEPFVDLDLRGLRCPLPVLRTRKALAARRPGELLRVSCTDPLAGLDISHLLRETGDTLVHLQRTDETQVFMIRKR